MWYFKMGLHLHFNHKLEKSECAGHTPSPCFTLDFKKNLMKIAPQQYWTKGQWERQQAPYGTSSAQASPVTPRDTCVDKDYTVTEISVCTQEPLPMFLSSVYIAETWWGNSFHPEWQSRLRSLLCLLASLQQPQQRTCTRLTRIYFEACHATSLFSAQGSHSRSCPVVRSRFLWCRLLHHCTKRLTLLNAALLQSLCCGNFRVVHWLSSAQAAFASSMWPPRWRNAGSLGLRQWGCSGCKMLKFDTKMKGRKER